ncbi:hypothetical protein NC651_016742 [Populus alba x Populus x berolinensis]|nr:hypothetical protein NC651_016742 [Populus alba x Populus x berolinensis]
MTSKKDSGNHGHTRPRLVRLLFAVILTFLLIALIVILLVWAILRPSKPKFILQDATVYAFNVSYPNFITSNFQVTVSSRNPDDRVGIYYDRLDIYGTYRDQQITLRTSIPTSYQGHKETNVWSPFIYGNSVPVSPYNSAALSQDQGAGVVMLMIKIDGRVRFKVGTLMSAKYNLHVRCPAYIQFGSRTSGIMVGDNVVKYQLATRCHKDCGNHGHKRRRFVRLLFAVILTFLLIALIVILIVWAILRPSKPKFILQDATVYAFNVSYPNSITSNFQVTVSSRNPDDRVGIYYDRLDIYGTYRDQQITLRTSIPSSYQGHKETNVWSPFIYGNSVPVSPYNSAALSQDQGAGVVMLMIKIDGRVRFKVGTVISAKYNLHVRCPAYIQFGSRTSGIMVGDNVVKYQLATRCHVSI